MSLALSEGAVPMVTVRRVEGLVCIDFPLRVVNGRRALPDAVRRNHICLKLDKNHGAFQRNDGTTSANCCRYATNFNSEDAARKFLKDNGVEDFRVVLKD